MTKIYYNGKRLRNKKGQFKKNRFLLKSFLIFLAIVVSVYATLYYKAQPVEYTKANTTEKQEKIDSKIIKIMKRDVVEMIRYAEVNRELEYGELFYTNDPHSSISEKCKKKGGKRDISCDSWGSMQWKLPTIQYYYKKLYSVELTEKEALLIALDEEKAMNLAEDCIFKIEGCVWEWSGAKKNKAYLVKQIPFIRELEASL